MSELVLDPHAQILAWADSQAQPGSFIAAGGYSPLLESLATRGWKGVWIVPWPSVEAVEWGNRLNVGLIAAALVYTSDRLVQIAPGVVSAAVHPSELYELWPGLPEPRFASISVTDDSSAEVFETLRDWVAIDAVEVKLPADEARREHLRAVLGPWRTLNLASDATSAIAIRV